MAERTRLVAAGADARRLGHRDRSRPAHARGRDPGCARHGARQRSPRSPCARSPHDTLAGDALLAMFAEGVHHFPVHGDRRHAARRRHRHRPHGPRAAHAVRVEERDRARRPRRARSPRPGRDLPHLVATMVRANADPIDVGRVGALVVDAMTERLLALAIDDLGDPPCAWAWLALGSAARHEQALHTDQDHALVYEPVPDAPDADPYFAALAERVTAGLEAAGIPRCVGDAMAVHPRLRRPLVGVRRAVRRVDGPPRSAIDRAVVDRLRLPAGRGPARRRAGPGCGDARAPVRARRSCARWPGGRSTCARRPGSCAISSSRPRASTRGASTSSTAASRS